MATPVSQVKTDSKTNDKPKGGQPAQPANAPAQPKGDSQPKEAPRTPEEKRKAFSFRANLQVRGLTAITERLEKMMRSKAYESTPAQREALLTAVKTLSARMVTAIEGEKKAEAPAIPEA